MPFSFSKSIVICTLLSLGLKFSDCVQNYKAARGLLAKSEPMGFLAEENGRNVEWKGCGKLFIYLIKATFCLFICCDYRASTLTLPKSDLQEE